MFVAGKNLLSETVIGHDFKSMKTFSSLATLEGHTGGVYCLIQLKSGELISGSGSYTLRVWDVESKSCQATLEGHTSHVYCLKQSKSGELISGSDDKS